MHLSVLFAFVDIFVYILKSLLVRACNSKQRPSTGGSRASSPAPAERPAEKLDYTKFKSRKWPHDFEFKCKGQKCTGGTSMYCNIHWEDLYMMKVHLYKHHGIGPCPF